MLSSASFRKFLFGTVFLCAATVAKGAPLPAVALLHTYGAKGVEATGSGTIVRDVRGRIYLMTVAHVIDGWLRMEIQYDQGFLRGKSLRVNLSHSHVVRGRGSDLRYLPLASNADLERVAIGFTPNYVDVVNSEIVAQGYPQGFYKSFSSKVLSEMKSPKNGLLETFESPKNSGDLHGMSGGPVFDREGHLVGAIDVWFMEILVGFSPIGPEAELLDVL